MRGRIWVAFSLLVVLGLILAGCGRQITAEEIVAKMQETVESTEDAHAVVAVDVNIQGIEVAVTAEVWEKSPNKLRLEVLETSQADLAGMMVVSDGEQGWAYNPAHNQVMVGPAGEIQTPLPQEMLTSLQEAIQQVMDASNVELAGEEAVTGRDAYKLVLNPKEEDWQGLFPAGGMVTLWVDKEQWIVLKAAYDGGTFGRGDMELQSFELNPGLADDLFQFEVPEGVEVVDVEAQQPEFLTLEEAKAQAGFPLLVPEYVPEGATLIEVFRIGGSFILRYDHSPQVAFAVVQGRELSEIAPFESLMTTMTGTEQTVTLRGQSAVAQTYGAYDTEGNTLLYWTENGVTVTVAGRISLDEAIKVAESLR